MHLLDWTIVVSYLIYVIWHGLKLSQNKESAFGFFLGGRSLPWWTVGLSIYGVNDEETILSEFV